MNKFFIITLLIFCYQITVAQVISKDSATVIKDSAISFLKDQNISTNAVQKTDSIKQKKKWSAPANAAIRSAILPGWGQIYNKKYWTVPIVYAALGVVGYTFVDNRKSYKTYKHAVQVFYAFNPLDPNKPPSKDSTLYNTLPEWLRKNYIDKKTGINILSAERNDYRKNMDYSALYFIIGWALNVMHATVDGHLSTFDISPSLALKLQPGYSEMARTNGLSMVIRFK